MGKIAHEYGAMILFETHDDWSNSVYIRSIMREVDSESVGVLWDIHHPVFNAKEDPSETWGNVGEWVRHTHLKDYVLDDDREQMCLIGDGLLPVGEFVRVLEKGGYDGYYSLEWPKKRFPDLEGPEKVFPHYVEYMKRLNKKL